MRDFNIDEWLNDPSQILITRDYGLQCEIIDVDMNKLYFHNEKEICVRPIKYRVYNNDGSIQQTLYCDITGHCNQNYHIRDFGGGNTHDLMFKD